MNKRIKSMPWSVKIAALFLLTVYVTMCIMAPMVGLAVFVGVVIFLAIVSVLHYLIFGN